VYSDPTICGCLYVGNQAAYNAYLNKVNQQQQLDMSTVTVPPGQEAGWDFSAWPEARYGAVRSRRLPRPPLEQGDRGEAVRVNFSLFLGLGVGLAGL